MCEERDTWFVRALEEVLGGERSAVGGEGGEGKMVVQVDTQQVQHNLEMDWTTSQ